MSLPTGVPATTAQPPKIYRAMKSDPEDRLPVVGAGSSAELGVRPGVDITVDVVGNVVLDASGMSVAPRWQNLPFSRIPRRLRDIVPGAAGADTTACFSLGAGPFRKGIVADGLELIPDRGQHAPVHGVIAPAHVVPLAQYQTNLANTRADWRIDERP